MLIVGVGATYTTVKFESAVAVPLSSVVVTCKVCAPPAVYERLIVPVAVAVPIPEGVNAVTTPSTLAVNVRMPP